MRSSRERAVEPPVVDIPAKNLMLGDLVMGRIVVGLDLANDRVVIWFDNRTFIDAHVADPVPVDRAWER